MPEYAGRFRFQDLTNYLYVTGPGGFLPVWAHRPITNHQYTQALNVAAMAQAYVVAVGTERINMITLHFQPLAVNQTVTIVNNTGAAVYDTVIIAANLINAADWVWIPDNDLLFDAAVGFTVNVTNAGAPVTNANLTISVEEYT